MLKFKKIFITMLLALILVATVITLALPVFAASGIDYADYVQGGTVKTVDDLVAAFKSTSSDRVYAKKVDGKPNTVQILSEGVVLTAPITVTAGSYTLIGTHCVIYRGFDNGSGMINIIPDGQGSATLNIGQAGATVLSEPFITFHGNKETFPEASSAMITVKGRGILNVNEGIKFTSSSVSGYGGAISAEIAELGTERTLLEPEVNINGCEFTDCSAVMGGGAIYLYGYYSGSSGGSISIKNTVFSQNTSKTEVYNGNGGAIYTVGGTVEMDGVTADKNEAHNGGFYYCASNASLSNGMVSYNKALIDGGAFYCASLDGITGALKLTETTVEHNEAAGNGGAIANFGKTEMNPLDASTISLMLITTNKAQGNGGGVYNKGSFVMNGGSISSCEAGKVGGGIYSPDMSSSVVIAAGEVNNCIAAHVGAVYCGGRLELSGGAIGNNRGEAPHIIVKQSIDFSKASFILNDVLGLCVQKTDGDKFYPHFEVGSGVTTNEKVHISYYKEKLDKNGEIKGYSRATENGIFVVGGIGETAKKGISIVELENRGLFSYKLNDDGTSSVRLVFLPIWVWVLILIAVLAVLAFVFKKKLLKLINFLKSKMNLQSKKPAKGKKR